MPATASKLNADLAKQFAWLLRPDVRDTFASPDNPAFGDWWLIKGRQAFPGWADSITPAQQSALFATSTQATLADVPLDVPQVVNLLGQYRPDAVAECTKEGQLQHEKFLAWAIVRGLPEHQLAQHAPRSLVAALDQPVPSTVNPPSDQSVPAATLLMYLLWRLMDSATQQTRNLFTPEGRLAYLGWFFNVVGQLGIAPLVAGRWKSWVKSQPSYTAAQVAWANASLALATTAPATSKADKPFGVNLYGFAYGELGIGEDLRMAVACCEAANIPYYVVNVDAGDVRQADRLLEGKTHELHSAQLPPYRTNIFCLPAFDTVSRIFMQKGASPFEGYHNIGWWPWELSVFPKAWKPYAFELVDEVWASSTFLEDMYKRSTDKPVHLVPLAVSVDRLQKHPRKYYGLPDNTYLFLYVFDFNSSVARKNPMAAVNAFKQAFPQTDKSVGLVLKTMNSNPNNPEWQVFLKECKADKRIYVLTETMDRPDVLGLIDCCDVYVSLHRAEGFGRTVSEAFLLNKYVIASNYSGNLNIFTKDTVLRVGGEIVPVARNYPWVDLVDCAVWFDPSIKEAANLMRHTFNSKSQRGDSNNSNESLSVADISGIVCFCLKDF
jgi:glycosyltransferase involved in cell wall biosynthesis